MDESSTNSIESFLESPPLVNFHLQKYRVESMEGTAVTEDIQLIKSQMVILKQWYRSMEKRVEELEDYYDEIYENVEKNEQKIHTLQQYSRRENIEIIGIPDNISDNELEPIVLRILNSIGVNITSFDITACHRLKKERNSSKRNVIVRFVSRKHSLLSLKNRRQLKNSEFSGFVPGFFSGIFSDLAEIQDVQPIFIYINNYYLLK